MLRILIRFSHGLGDAAQLSVVLKHLKRHRTDWEVDVETGLGKESLFYGLCRRAFIIGTPAGDYDHVFDLGWYENYNGYRDCPNTKVTNTLREVFEIEPDPQLLGYEFHPPSEDLAAAEAYYDGLGLPTLRSGRRAAILCHYRGNTSAEKKDLSGGDLLPLAERCHRHGLALVVLDWDNRTERALIEHPAVTVCSQRTARELWKGYGSGDGARLAALIGQAAGFIGIDSGPGHVAGGTATPTVIVWTRHHPVMFYDLCPNVIHLLPANHREIPPANREPVWNYFRNHYNFFVYGDLAAELPTYVLGHAGFEALTENPMPRHHMLTAANFHTEYYEEHRAAGLDYLGHGDWQQAYARWLVEALGGRGEHWLDVGCACGSIAQGLRSAGALAHGVDLNNHMIALGKQHFPRLPLYVCDAVNLHLFGPESFQVVHTNQVAEHWKVELVPFILREFRRVLKPGGVLFTVMDTEDLFERQKRDHAVEDPTNNCIKPLAWWHERMTEAGLERATELEPALHNHHDSYLRRYDWDWCVYRRPADPHSNGEAHDGVLA